MAKNTITTPIKDQVMADNSTLSSNEIKKRIDTAAASILPEVTGEDEGKVLTVGSDGSWKAASIPNELPVPEASDKGSFISVNNGNYYLVKRKGLPNLLYRTISIMNYTGTWTVSGITGYDLYMTVPYEFPLIWAYVGGMDQQTYQSFGFDALAINAHPIDNAYEVALQGYEKTTTGIKMHMFYLKADGNENITVDHQVFTMTADT